MTNIALLWAAFIDFVYGVGNTPRDFCLALDTSLISWAIIADFLIAAAYYTLTVGLVLEIRRKRVTIPDFKIGLFAVSSFMVASSKLISAWTLIHPSYWMEVLFDLAVGLVSTWMAVLLPFFRLKHGRSVYWWKMCRDLRHEVVSLQTDINDLRILAGDPPLVWPVKDKLPPGPEG